MTKKLSDGFAGANTKTLDGLTKEIEKRIATPRNFVADSFNPTKMDIFTDEFGGPGVSEAFAGGDFSKGDYGYQVPHDDYPNESRRKTRSEIEMAAAGRAADQEGMDQLDENVQKNEGGIKKPEDQFPGNPGPEEFHKHMERRLTRLEKL